MPEDLTQNTEVSLPLGHLLAAWDVVSNQLSSTDVTKNLTALQKKAIWGLEDALEEALLQAGVSAKPANEWDKLMERAYGFVEIMPVDFVDK